jgi:hypothetical protein
MKDIILPVEKELLEKELTEDRFVRKTNKGSNEIYCFTLTKFKIKGSWQDFKALCT